MSRGSRLFLGICGLVGAVLMGMLAPTILQKLYTSSTYLFGPQSTANISTKRVPPPQKPTPSSTRREIGDSADAALYDQAKSPFSIAAMSLIGLIMGIGCGAVLLRFGERSSSRWDKMDVSDRVTFFVGTFAGVIAALPFLMLFSAIGLNIYMPVAVVGLTLGFAALSVYALKSMEDFLPWTKGRIRGRRRGIKLLDTNVIIDGRIYDVARTGFLQGELYVPGFVLEELQYIADSHDPLRRQRGRRGLEVLRHMQQDFPMAVQIHDRLAPEMSDGVDGRLIRLAIALGGDIVTNDFNLNRVAALQDVKVLNLNDLALGMRPSVLPSETLNLMIAREGSQPHQGIGYLDDGTMVVVENGKIHMGELLDVVVTQVIQTERGKMIFAELPDEDPTRGRNNPQRDNRR